MKQGIFRSAAITFTCGLVAAVAAGCSSPSTDGGDGVKPAFVPVGETSQALMANIPQCNPNVLPNQPFTYVRAIPRAQGGYTHSFPNAGMTGDVQTYESRLWSIPRANGYEYLVQVVVNMNGQWVPTTSQFFIVGIMDLNASPPYLMSPPAPSGIRLPAGTTPFSPTAYDFQAEENLDSAYYGKPPVSSDSYGCVAVLNASGTLIDFFPLVAKFDPSGQPW